MTYTHPVRTGISFPENIRFYSKRGDGGAADDRGTVRCRGIQTPGALVGVMVAAVAFLWVREQRDLRRSIGGAPMTTLGWESWDIVEQMRASSFHPRPGSSVAFLDDPFGTLDMYTLARLWFHDCSVNIRGVNRVPITEEELARMDYVFKFEGRKLIRIR